MMAPEQFENQATAQLKAILQRKNMLARQSKILAFLGTLEDIVDLPKYACESFDTNLVQMGQPFTWFGKWQSQLDHMPSSHSQSSTNQPTNQRANQPTNQRTSD